ncbi:hypothetical protein AAC387_Pa02g5063 [Persea americana]
MKLSPSPPSSPVESISTLFSLLSVLENCSSQKPDGEAAALSTLFSNRRHLHPLLQSKPTSFFRDILPKISTKRPTLDPVLRFSETIFGEARRRRCLPRSGRPTTKPSPSSSLFLRNTLRRTLPCPHEEEKSRSQSFPTTLPCPHKDEKSQSQSFPSSLQSSTTYWAMDYSTPTMDSQIRLYLVLFI